jgi:hypothetical protein
MVKSSGTFEMPDQTLAALWRATAQRTSRRHATACVTFGIFGLAALAFVDQLRIPGLVGIVIGAFGMYAFAVQPSLGGHVFRPRTVRATTVVAVAIAAIAAAAVFMLGLAALFGGSIEVMRR